MIKVLGIGMCQNAKFTDTRWKWIMKQLSQLSDYMIAFTAEDEVDIRSSFNEYCDIYLEPATDPEFPLNTFRMVPTTPAFWDKLTNYDYHIDYGFTNIDFFRKEQHIASLEVVDYENFFILMMEDNDIRNLEEAMPCREDNIKECNRHRDDIDDLIDADWIPLGYTAGYSLL